MNFKDFILFEDDSIIVLNKPAGWLSIPGGYASDAPCLKLVLAQEFGQIWAVHRLDKLTSGVILFAKNENAHRNLNSQFSNRIPAKNYRAISHGFPIWQEKIIRIPLRVNGDRHHRTIPDIPQGKPAETKVRVLEQNELFCKLDVFPKTGLTHQIRAHLAACGLPVAGDHLYWRAGRSFIKNSYEYPFKDENMCLHAFSITLQHPLTHQPVQFAAPEPDYFSNSYHTKMHKV